jgi:RimJ/RimL family protein N-acetyltransferase
MVVSASLFDTRLTFRAAIAAVLEGRCGSLTAAHDCARLDLGPFSMLGGEPTSVDARALLTGLTFPRIFVDSSAWHALIREHNMNCRFELDGRTQFSPDQLDDERLRNLRSVPREMRLVPLDAALLRAALDHLSTDLLIEAVFADPETFASAGGFGFAVVQEDRVLAAATSAIVSDRHIEIQINTAAEHHRKGLGTAVGAAIALASRARGLEPGWDTGSPASAGLARKLGFRVAGEHEWLCGDRSTA